MKVNDNRASGPISLDKAIFTLSGKTCSKSTVYDDKHINVLLYQAKRRKNTVELGYNVVKGTEYFVSL